MVVTPSTASLATGQSIGLQAVVTSSVNTAVTWTVVEGPAGGSVSASGVYTAPSTTGVFRVMATSQADPAAQGTSTVTVTTSAPTVAVTVSPNAATLETGQSLPFQATVTGTTNTTTIWSILEGAAGGSITSAGIYTAPSTPGEYRVVATSQAAPTASSTAVVTVTAPPPGGSPMTTAHRTSGVAPLAVFFDAVDTTPSGTASPFRWTSGVYQPADYEGTLYAWDFGDPSSGSWTLTGNSRNTATGYTAAHVYENPGTYSATLTLTDTSGTVRKYVQTITVSRFNGTTYYVAANGSDSNNGLTPSTPFLTVAKGMSMIGTNRAILFRRGDTFTVNRSWAISAPGPGIIGAYGTGNRPILNCPDLGDVNIFSPSGAGTDWRVMDLEMRGPNLASDTGPVGPPVTEQAVNSTFLRLRLPSWKVSIGWGDWTPIYATPHDGMFVVECELPSAGNYAAYVGGRHLAIMGNVATDSGTTHLLRVWQAHKAVISNNHALRPGGQRHALKLHGPELNDGRPETRWVTITDNYFAGSATSQWTVSMGSQSDASNENDPVSHVIFERNKFTSSPSTVVDIETEARNIIIRNNIFDDTLAPSSTSILFTQRNAYVPHPDDIRIYNNTVFRGSTATDTSCFLETNSTATNLRVRNNFMAVPSLTNAALISGAGGTGFAADHNMLTTTPGFTSAASGDF